MKLLDSGVAWLILIVVAVGLAGVATARPRDSWRQQVDARLNTLEVTQDGIDSRLAILEKYVYEGVQPVP